MPRWTDVIGLEHCVIGVHLSLQGNDIKGSLGVYLNDILITPYYHSLIVSFIGYILKIYANMDICDWSGIFWTYVIEAHFVSLKW